MLTVRDAVDGAQREDGAPVWIWDGKLPARKIGNQLFVEETGLAQFESGAREHRAAEQAALVDELRAFHGELRARGRAPVGTAAELVERARAGEA